MPWPLHRWEVAHLTPPHPVAGTFLRHSAAQRHALAMGDRYAVRGITWPRWYFHLRQWLH